MLAAVNYTKVQDKQMWASFNGLFQDNLGTRKINYSRF